MIPRAPGKRPTASVDSTASRICLLTEALACHSADLELYREVRWTQRLEKFTRIEGLTRGSNSRGSD